MYFVIDFGSAFSRFYDYIQVTSQLVYQVFYKRIYGCVMTQNDSNYSLSFYMGHPVYY